ncbi:MAG: PQQ-binding-like beta-propeller repeat protein [Alphaproteobacteria bacterium]|nr:PQQ-binding-like beta-propeller repeat protein [Alphaproteobacteria bacterium]
MKKRILSLLKLPTSYFLLPTLLLFACSKPDPILPGLRTPVFDGGAVMQEKGPIPEDILSDGFARIKITEPQTGFEQNLNNEIFEVSDSGEKRKIFAGFPTTEKINVPRTPVFYKNFVYAGLTTGELVKVNPKTRELAWIADIFFESDMLGGGSVLDIVAPVVIDEDRLFAGGMGGEFCRLNMANGHKIWCAHINVATPFVIAGDLAFVMGANSVLYALDARNGTIYWTAKTRRAYTPKPESADGKYFVRVGKERFYAATGKLAGK